MKKVLAISTLLLFPLVVSSPAFSSGFEIVAPHRAVYDIKMVEASERSGIKSMDGRMVYQVSGNECDGISLQYRFLTNVSTARDQYVSDQQTSTYESADGKVFNFHTKNFLNEQLEETIKGKAKQVDGGVEVMLESPAEGEFEFSNANFLTSYLVKMIDLAKSGEHFMHGDLFDGSGGGDETMATSSFISNPKSIKDSKDGAGSGIVKDLESLKAWSVSMSYFKKNIGATAEHTPIFESSFLLYENGVSTDLVMRYPEYILSGKIVELEMFEAQPCQKDG